MTNHCDLSNHIEELLDEEKKTDENIQKIMELSEIHDRIKKDIVQTQNSIKVDKLELERTEESVTQLTCELEVLKLRQEAWRHTHKDAKETFERESKKLEELNIKAFNKKQIFFDKVDEFLNNYGIKAALNKNFQRDVRGQMAEAMDVAGLINDDEISSVKPPKKSEELKLLENEIELEKKSLDELQKKLEDIKNMNEKLKLEYESGEFERLRNALKYSRDETIKYQKEIEKTQQLININLYKSREQKVEAQTSQYWKPVNDFNTVNDQHINYLSDQPSCSNEYKLSEILEPYNAMADENEQHFHGSETERNENTFQVRKRFFKTGGDVYKETEEMKLKAKNNTFVVKRSNPNFFKKS